MRVAVLAIVLSCLAGVPGHARSNPVNEGLRQLCPVGHAYDVNRGCVPAGEVTPRRVAPGNTPRPDVSAVPGGRLDQIGLLQFLLVWTGDYNGTIDGIGGPRTSRALAAFLDRAGIGVNREDPWEALVAEAAAGLADAGFRIERDRGLDVVFGLPGAMLRPAPSGDPLRRRFASQDGSVELEVAVLRGYTLGHLHRRLAERRDRQIEYEKVTAGWFVMTGSDPAKDFYVRYHATGGAIRGFSISYDRSRAAALGPSIIAMSNVFRADAGAADDLIIFAERVVGVAARAVAVAGRDWEDCEASDGNVAVAACTRIIDAGETPENLASAYFNRGMAHHAAERHALAVADFSEVIRIAPDDGEAYYVRGVAHAAAGDPRRAVADFSAAIRLRPDDAEAHLERGVVSLAKLDDPDGAVADFTRVLALDPGNVAAHYGRAVAYDRKGDLGRALGDFRRVAWSAKPGEPWFDHATRRVAEIEDQLAARPAAPPATAPEPAAGVLSPGSSCDEQHFGGDGIAVTVACKQLDGRPVTLITMTGDIVAGDDRHIRKALLAADTARVIVAMASDGGDLEAGIAIGRAIWLSEAATVVVDGDECASACALAWLAGRPRYMAARAAIGFHAPWHDTGSKPVGSTAGSAVVGGYLRDLGLTSDAIGYINEPGPDELRYLTFEDADALNIAVRRWEPSGSPVAAPPAGSTPEAVLSAGEAFRDCDGCPEMVVVPAGSFLMGSPDDEAGRQADEGPRHEVRFAVPFAIGRNEVTFAEWDACVADGGCDGYSPADAGWGRGERPVINVSWLEARTYAAWLSRKTGRDYRLPSEAEWEYAARGGTTTPYAFGTALGPAEANVAGERTVPVGSHEANGFGLLDMHGNVWEWVEDCYADSYAHAPADGAAVSPPGCDWRVVRGGAWNTRAVENMRSAFRFRRIATSSRDSVGFRVARGLGSDARASQADPP